ncbi:hypothetical protein [Blastococcus sp. URHD0036]|uniref:hypothetical protein n=1 Tax=Blastococcus sp. URHD0036 TaxID=1380356 RepID=UPI00049863A1|nr:hypothetical protein [Blastococcus sp. URHD0036]
MPTSTHRAPAIWSGVALLLALVAVVLTVSTPADAGANIGAGMVVLLAMSASFVTAVLLVGTGQRGARLAAAGAALAWVAYFALAVDDTGPRWPAAALIAVAVLVPAGWCLRVLTGRDPR